MAEGERLAQDQLEARGVPMKEGLESLRRDILEKHSRHGNVVVLVEGAWGTGKSKLAKAMQKGIGGVPSEKIQSINIDQETKEIFGGKRRGEKTIFEKARKARGRNLVNSLFPDQGSRPDVFIIDSEAAGRVLIDEIGILTSNVLRVNLVADDSTRWENLYLRSKTRPEQTLKILRESPSRLSPKANINLNTSREYRLTPIEIETILREKE